jgi:HTH-type transcriptional regulator / antitoxin HipB
MSTRAWNELRTERLASPEARQAYDAAARVFRLGEEVRRLRIDRGLSQSELAERMGLPQAVVSRLEAGGVEPRLKTLDRVAHALGVEVDVRFLVPRADERSVS